MTTAGASTGIVAAVLLAGGAGSRLGGADKPALMIDGVALIERALAAVGTVPVVVVGPDRQLSRPVTSVREDPPGSGPAAALAAGVLALPAQLADDGLVAVLATDLPQITPATIDRLLAAARTTAASGPDGVVLTDATEREQLLLGLWRHAALVSACAARPNWASASLRSLLAPMSRVTVSALGEEAADIDTTADLRRWNPTM